jgi:hypothetical protein
LVLMRERKPWTLARRRFFGWYVRFVDMSVAEEYVESMH